MDSLIQISNVIGIKWSKGNRCLTLSSIIYIIINISKINRYSNKWNISWKTVTVLNAVLNFSNLPSLSDLTTHICLKLIEWQEVPSMPFLRIILKEKYKHILDKLATMKNKIKHKFSLISLFDYYYHYIDIKIILVDRHKINDNNYYHFNYYNR